MMKNENETLQTNDPETSPAGENEAAGAGAGNGEDSAREAMIAGLRESGAISPELIFAAVAAGLQVAPDGTPSNAAALIAHLKRTYPEQFAPVGRLPVSIDAGVRSGTQALTREALSKMSVAEVGRLDWSDVRNVLSEP